MNMKRHRAVFLVTAAAVLIALGLLARDRYRLGRIEQAKRAFHKAGALAEQGGWPVPLEEIVRLLGNAESKQFLSQISEKYKCFHFDGANRFCMLARKNFRYEPERGTSDVLYLASTQDSESAGTWVLWYGPPGFHVTDVAFLDDSIHVDAVIDSDKESEPQQYRIPWEPGSVPKSGIFEEQERRPAPR